MILLKLIKFQQNLFLPMKIIFYYNNKQERGIIPIDINNLGLESWIKSLQLNNFRAFYNEDTRKIYY